MAKPNYSVYEVAKGTIDKTSEQPIFSSVDRAMADRKAENENSLLAESDHEYKVFEEPCYRFGIGMPTVAIKQ
jgi:hypothetical protein